ncbi:MAG: SAM-dependent methyltransferase [Hyphomicrobiaceae bacterium]
MDETTTTALAQALAARIASEGPLALSAYMAACLGDAGHGYYRTQQAIGAAGDFITAPEISQVFGEIVGLWSAVAWQGLGEPERWRLIELGPGRGTLMQDALRAMKVLPAALAGLEVVLVEANPRLADEQRRRLASGTCPVSWRTALAPLPGDLPAVIVANEFLDALPIDQLWRTDTGWHMRTVALAPDGRLQFASRPADAALAARAVASVARHEREPRPGEIVEVRDLSPLLAALAPLTVGSLTCLFIDYGHDRAGYGDTLQAVRRHAYEPPLAHPGQADLSAPVDFAATAADLASLSLTPSASLPQGVFLGRLGAVERASRLMAASPTAAAGIEAAVHRLMAPSGMGGRFRALAAWSGRRPPPPPFT